MCNQEPPKTVLAIISASILIIKSRKPRCRASWPTCAGALQTLPAKETLSPELPKPCTCSFKLPEM